MIDVSAYPECAKRLHFQRANLAEPAMNAYWAAVCVAEDFADDSLADFGGFNFERRTEANGYLLLGRLEQFIRSDRRRKASQAALAECEASVRSYLGANGVKVSGLKGISDYHAAAIVLWPPFISPTMPDMKTLRSQINGIPKKQRSKLARKNVSGLPATWSARAVQ